MGSNINTQRLGRMHHNAERLSDRGHLRHGLTIDHARDVMYAYTAAELYELLVSQQRWTLDLYADFIFRGLAAELLDD